MSEKVYECARCGATEFELIDSDGIHVVVCKQCLLQATTIKSSQLETDNGRV